MTSPRHALRASLPRGRACDEAARGRRAAWGGPTGAGDPAMKDTATDTAGMGYLQSVPRRWVTTYIPIGAFVFVLLFPFYWMVITSFKPNEELLSRDGNPFWVIKPTLAHFQKLIFETSYHDWMWNTVLVSVVTPAAEAAEGEAPAAAEGDKK